MTPREEALTVTRCILRGYQYHQRVLHAEANCSILAEHLNIQLNPTDFNLTNQGELPMSQKYDLEEQRAAALSMYVAILMAAGKPTSDVSIDFLKGYEDAEILALVVEKMHEVLAKVVEHKGG